MSCICHHGPGSETRSINPFTAGVYTYMVLAYGNIVITKQYFNKYFKLKVAGQRIFHILLNYYLFEGCYFGAIMGSAKIAKIKCL